MLNQKGLFTTALVVFACFFDESAASAQTPRCYTLSSLRGTYSVIGTYGANLAMSFGTRSYDGNGNLTGTFLLNAPTADSTGARTITTGTQMGTYTVNVTAQVVLS